MQPPLSPVHPPISPHPRPATRFASDHPHSPQVRHEASAAETRQSPDRRENQCEDGGWFRRGTEGTAAGGPGDGASLGPPSPSSLQAAGQASLTSFHVPYATAAAATTSNYFSPATLHPVPAPQPLPGWVPPLTHAARRPQSPGPWAPPPASARSSFVSVENRLYAQAEKRPLHAGADHISLPDRLGRQAALGPSGVR